MTQRKRHENRGLRKRCDCRRSNWLKCAHPWYFSYMPRRGPSAGVHVRKNLDDLAGKEIDGKTDAETEVRRIKTALDKGDLVAIVTVDEQGHKRIEVRVPADPANPTAPPPLRLEQLLATYVKEYVVPERPSSEKNAGYQSKAIGRTLLDLPTGERKKFGDWFVRDVNTAALEKFRAARRTQAMVKSEDKDGEKRSRRVGGVLATNRNLAFLRAAFNWSVRLGYVDATPFKRSTETVVKLSQEIARRRRLEGDEGERLLAASGVRLRPLVEAALETGCRSGELLSLQWHQVRGLSGTRPELVLPAGKTKTKRERVIPISARLKVILEMRRNDPDGEPHGPQDYVFGNEIGEQTLSVKTAWKLACRRAKIEDLHFHDLRREAGSRWLEGGVPLQVVRDWLGHSNISQTSTYLESTLKGAHEAMRRFEELRAVQPGATKGETPLQTAPQPSESSDPGESVSVN